MGTTKHKYCTGETMAVQLVEPKTCHLMFSLPRLSVYVLFHCCTVCTLCICFVCVYKNAPNPQGNIMSTAPTNLDRYPRATKGLISCRNQATNNPPYPTCTPPSQACKDSGRMGGAVLGPSPAHFLPTTWLRRLVLPSSLPLSLLVWG